MRNTGRMIGCTITPMNSIRPKPTSKPKKIAPTGISRPTEITNLSRMNGPISGLNNHSGPNPNVSIAHSTIASTDSAANAMRA